DIVIKAVAVVIKKFPGANLAITGGGSAENSLKNLVKELKLENKVKFLGIVSPAILSKLYQAADIYAIASTAETQSISLMKAMATGLPVIGVRAWALPEYINNNNGFIVEPGDYQAMADKIVLLCQDNNLRKKLGQGRAEMVKNFSAENIAKQWEEIYSNVLNKKII
ncbi:MAG: glycosyltransferase, partial [Candidatus Falkowbacteria bacterium]|nr:glycosyltransferase [Candidatus Falkowbacteria bacterium]